MQSEKCSEIKPPLSKSKVRFELAVNLLFCLSGKDGPMKNCNMRKLRGFVKKEKQ